MQGDDGLAGSRATLDGVDARKRRPDDVCLVGLDQIGTASRRESV